MEDLVARVNKRSQAAARDVILGSKKLHLSMAASMAAPSPPLAPASGAPQSPAAVPATESGGAIAAELGKAPAAAAAAVAPATRARAVMDAVDVPWGRGGRDHTTPQLMVGSTDLFCNDSPLCTAASGRRNTPRQPPAGVLSLHPLGAVHPNPNLTLSALFDCAKTFLQWLWRHGYRTFDVAPPPPTAQRLG